MSHAEGANTQANGDISHSEGEGTIANGKLQHVQGKYNKEDTTSAFIIGNGILLIAARNLIFTPVSSSILGMI